MSPTPPFLPFGLLYLHNIARRTTEMQLVNKKLSDSFSSPAKPPVSEENIEDKPGIPKSDSVRQDEV